MTIKMRFEKFTKEIKPTAEHIDEANRQTDFRRGSNQGAS